MIPIDTRLESRHESKPRFLNAVLHVIHLKGCCANQITCYMSLHRMNPNTYRVGTALAAVPVNLSSDMRYRSPGFRMMNWNS
jgi:hypothetical protein